MTVTWMEAAAEERALVNRVQQEWSGTLLHEFIRVAPVVKGTHTCKEVIEQFGKQPDCNCIVVCDEGNKPLGLVMKGRLSIIETHRFGREIYYGRSIVKLMDTDSLVVDKNISPQQLLDLALGRDEATLYDCVIVTEDETFLGIMTMADLLRLSTVLQRQSVASQIRTINGAESMISEIDKSVVNVRSAAQLGERMSETMVDLTLRGKNELDKVTGAIHSLNANANKQEGQIQELQESAGSIGSISKLIRDLADQCNLLAVNATIEAARAGEHGRGFAVVANEVRKLAAQTKQSADEINMMIKTILGAVRQTVELVGMGRVETESSQASIGAAFQVFEQLFHTAASNSKSAKEIGKLSSQACQQSERVTGEMKRLIGEMQAGRGAKI
ncbi:CBS domain-containing protein [Paenibacillus oenotherae]|uniref:CBS domain-containing protein n=1 Tax=Paenibacillus oenotherae TaxID=1435645 RepID=A0ABS7DBX2_9BACL|nr:methyl-accepting chemotaxis protein [Paenibacillus oenotherae]MBW7476648.1 CBS domain-containing protein [Paenibacillus oenotherae]